MSKCVSVKDADPEVMKLQGLKPEHYDATGNKAEDYVWCPNNQKHMHATDVTQLCIGYYVVCVTVQHSAKATA